MKQIFILGASSVYGIGAESAGWGDLVKLYVHHKMFSNDGVGDKYEIFNFSKPGSTIEFVIDTTEWVYNKYSRDGDNITFITVGGNDAKAEYEPDNFVCTPDDYKVKLTHLFDKLQHYNKKVVFVSNGFVDESKTNPKISPFENGKLSYFTNERRTLFNDITKQICESKGIDFVAVDIDKNNWVKNYLYSDGLHPNQAGYQKVFEALKPLIDESLND